MPDNLEMPPALVAKIDQLRAMNHDLLMTFVRLAEEGFENGHDSMTIFGTMGMNIDQSLGMARFDRNQTIALLTAAVVEMARAQHEGDWG